MCDKVFDVSDSFGFFSFFVPLDIRIRMLEILEMANQYYRSNHQHPHNLDFYPEVRISRRCPGH